jgi:hypothetical protein
MMMSGQQRKARPAAHKARLFAILLASCCTSLVPITAQEWTDRAEYDLALGIRAQAAPQARLALLDQWRLKYPNSPMRIARAELTLGAAQMLGDTGRILDTSRELIAADANNFTGLYWIALLAPNQSPVTPKLLTDAEKAARKVLRSADAFFASTAGKNHLPQKKQVLAMARRTLGWVEWRNNKIDAALVELNAALDTNARLAEASAWIGSILATDTDRKRKVDAIWHLARASSLDGEGALPAQQRREVRELLEAAYTSHHGALDGLDDIVAKSREAVQPPTAFAIESAAEVATRKADEALAASNPQLFEWVKIRRRLAGPNGDAELRKLEGVALPTMKGWVIRCEGGPKPNEVIVGVQDSSIEEVALKLDVRMPKCPEVGLAVEFEGLPVSLIKEPFRFTVGVEVKAVRGW